MEWISVKDRLPIDNQEVVVRTTNKKKLYVCFFSKKWANTRNTFSILAPDTLCMTVDEYTRIFILPLRKITHWMSLPTPPVK